MCWLLLSSDVRDRRGLAPVTIYGTLEQQLSRCNLEIKLCESYLGNPENTDRAGAELGLLDWLVNREDVLVEMRDTESNLPDFHLFLEGNVNNLHS